MGQPLGCLRAVARPKTEKKRGIHKPRRPLSTWVDPSQWRLSSKAYEGHIQAGSGRQHPHTQRLCRGLGCIHWQQLHLVKIQLLDRGLHLNMHTLDEIGHTALP